MEDFRENIFHYIYLLLGQVHLPPNTWILSQYYNSKSSTINNRPKRKKSKNSGRCSNILSRFINNLIEIIVAILTKVVAYFQWIHTSQRTNLFCTILVLLIPCVHGVNVVHISMQTCGPIMAGIFVAMCLLAVSPGGNGDDLENAPVETSEVDMQGLSIEELGSILEENEDKIETSLVTNDLEHTVILHFKHYQEGPKRGTGRWLINILVGPYTYGVKKIHNSNSKGVFHCQKCLSGYGKSQQPSKHYISRIINVSLLN